MAPPQDHEREKHAHSILQFQFNEVKETLKQSEELLNVSTVEINFSWPKRCFDISQRRGRGGDYQDS